MIIAKNASDLPVVLLPTACCSATKDVVTLRRGMLNNLETRLKTEIDTPIAANSTDPIKIHMKTDELIKLNITNNHWNMNTRVEPISWEYYPESIFNTSYYFTLSGI